MELQWFDVPLVGRALSRAARMGAGEVFTIVNAASTIGDNLPPPGIGPGRFESGKSEWRGHFRKGSSNSEFRHDS